MTRVLVDQMRYGTRNHHVALPQAGGSTSRVALRVLALVCSVQIAGQARAVSLGPDGSAQIVHTQMAPAAIDPAAVPGKGMSGAGAPDAPVQAGDVPDDPSVSLAEVFRESGPEDASAEINRQTTQDTLPATVETFAVGPILDYGKRRDATVSVTEVLRAFVSPEGESSAAAPARTGQRHDAGGSWPLGGLRAVVVELLEDSLTAEGTLNGKVVFSILGKGLFTMAVARDGSGISLSELGSGTRIVLWASPEGRFERRRQRNDVSKDDPKWSDGSPEILGSGGFGQGNPLASLMSAIAGALNFIRRAAVNIGSSPIMVVLLLPLVLIWILLDILRQRMSGVTAELPETRNAVTVAATPEPAPRRQRSRKRVRWRAIFAEIRNSLGFPKAELIRESDREPRPRRHRRRRRRYVGI